MARLETDVAPVSRGCCAARDGAVLCLTLEPVGRHELHDAHVNADVCVARGACNCQSVRRRTDWLDWRGRDGDMNGLSDSTARWVGTRHHARLAQPRHWTSTRECPWRLTLRREFWIGRGHHAVV